MTSKKLKFISGGHFEFQQNLKKSPVHLYTVGNVIVKFEQFLTLSFKVFAPTKNFGVDFWRSFGILVASLKYQLHIHM